MKTKIDRENFDSGIHTLRELLIEQKTRAIPPRSNFGNVLFLKVLRFLLLFPLISTAAPMEIEWREISDNAGGSKGAIQLQSGKILATRTESSAGELRVICSQSTDNGKSWSTLSTIVQESGRADLGDGHLLQLPSGTLLYSYRHHRFAEDPDPINRYSIRIAMSEDFGKTWNPHSVVARSNHNFVKEPDALRGLWASFLLQKKDGTLFCFYDDEETPHRKGFHRHQWLTMKQWDPVIKEWINPVTVSRAHDESNLSRDGMPTLIELPNGRLICVYESVKTAPPYANCIRSVTSDDGGKTWSWIDEKREIVFEAGDHLAISPWMIRLPTGELICIFATDQDRGKPAISGTDPRKIFSDLKAIVSSNNGKSWELLATPIFKETHRSYLPGIILLNNNEFLVTFLDFAEGRPRALRGVLSNR